MKKKLLILALLVSTVATIFVAMSKEVTLLGDIVVSANGEDITFYSGGQTIFYSGARYNDSFYYVRIASPEYYYWNGTIFVNSSAFTLEFPIGWEKLVKLYSDGACFLDGNLTEKHYYVTSISSSAASAKLTPNVVKGCKYCMQVIFYKTTTSTSDKKSYTFIGYIFDSCEPESYDFVQVAKYGNITQTKLNLVFS